MKRLCLIIAVLMVGCTSTPKVFYLRSVETGLLKGPFVFRKGEYLPSYGSGSFIAQPRPGEFAMIERLKSIDVTEIQFVRTSVIEAVAELNRKQRLPIGGTPIPITVDLDGYCRLDHGDSPGMREDATPADWEAFRKKQKEVPSLTMGYRYISLFEILECISDLTDLALVIDGKSVELSQKWRIEESANHRLHRTSRGRAVR